MFVDWHILSTSLVMLLLMADGSLLRNMGLDALVKVLWMSPVTISSFPENLLAMVLCSVGALLSQFVSVCILELLLIQLS